MTRLRFAALIPLVAACLLAPAKDKKKPILPADVLSAQSVLVLIDPDAGMALDAPTANRDAQANVEKALRAWGRFYLAPDLSTADLVIVVRKGNRNAAQPTIGGIPQNNRPVILQPSDSSTTVGGRAGSPFPGDPTGAQPGRPTSRMELGSTDDEFTVYRGKRNDPLETSPVWRYNAKDALRAPAVPAVDEFRKAVVESEKQLATHP